MVSRRRILLAGAAFLPVAGVGLWAFARNARGPVTDADGVTQLGWRDLLPPEDARSVLTGFIDHEQTQSAGFFVQPPSSGVRREWDGQMVSLPGFVVPMRYDGDAVSEFILVPYVGACIHVPPPPANQLVYVRAETAVEVQELFAAVRVTGVMGIIETDTNLAEISYLMDATRIAPVEV
ncbi:MAG: DUF3299 domain-containing protein [Pseudomonadota bacterium]